MPGVDFNFDEYPTLLALARDNSYFRVVIGPAGSGKTSGLFALLLFMALKQYPGDDGVRRVRTAVLRQSYQQLAKATISTMRTILGDIITISDGKPPSGKCTLPLADGTRLEWEFVFYALEAPNAEEDARGAEYTNLLVDEVSSVVNEELLLLFLSRVGRYPSRKHGRRNEAIAGALGATNGPKMNHWLYEWSRGKRDVLFSNISKQINRPYFKLFQQPEALLLQENGVYTPNPKAENVKNLPGEYGYYYSMLANPPEHIMAFVMGKFVPMSTGKVVYPAFRVDTHVISYDTFIASWGKVGKIGLTFDFGRTPVCLCWLELSGGGLVVFDEFMAEDISIEGFWENVVYPKLRSNYPLTIFGERGYVTGDPAGADMTQAVDQSPYSVLQQHGVYIEFPADVRKDSLEPRVEATRRRMARLDVLTGVPMLRITDNCKYLIDALLTGYVYESVRGAKGQYKDTPTKTHVGWASDLANALEYLCLYKRQELEPAKPNSIKNIPEPLFGG